VDEEGKKASSKEISKGLQGQGRIQKYQQALLNWGMKPASGVTTLKAAESAASLGLTEITEILGRRALAYARQEEKPKKDAYVKLLDIFDQAGAFELAVEAGQIATQLDPSDGQLAAKLKEMLASATIRRGKFEETVGEEGGFRRNIRDAEKQAQLEAEDSLTKTEDVKDRVLAAKKADYDQRPTDSGAIDGYGRALLERGKPQDELKAMLLFKKAFEETGQFRYRVRQGEVQLQIDRRTLRAMKAKLEKSPGDEGLREKVAEAEAKLLEKEVAELQIQVENYPTNLGLKFQLGKRLHAAGQHNEAIGLFQKAEEDPQHRREVLRYKAEAFLAIEWPDEAVTTYREALKGIPDEGSELAMETKYGLMCALQEKAGKDRELDPAEEADRLASEIAMKRFDYRDIVDRRKAIKDLIRDLRA
jgi:tetratricopeptide (TPR) repeat protein